VPVGQYADALIERAGKQLGAKLGKAINAHVVSREANARLVLAKVELGEADAAIVYRSDIRRPECKPQPAGAPPSEKACEHAQAIAIPAELSERVAYAIGVAARAKEPILARELIDHVLSSEGQALLAEHGFIPARPPLAAAEPEP
jgi:molybdate transport system substrate-binding protein